MQNLSSQHLSSADSSDSCLNPHQQLAEYKKNMKNFIKEVQKEYEATVAKYQKQIEGLKKQNLRLREALNCSKTRGGKNMNQRSMKFDENIQRDISPVPSSKKISTNILPNGISKYSVSQGSSKFVADIEPSDFILNQSKFEANSQINKIARQGLMTSIQMGRANLHATTQRLSQLLGKSCKKHNFNPEISDDENKIEFIGKSNRRKNSHNDSLSSICSSLDNSFHAQKSREKHAKKKKQKAQQERKRRERQKQTEQIEKQIGIKNILRSMRNNMDEANRSIQQRETVKGSKLLEAGVAKKKQARSRTKVMFNPVSVDLVLRNTSNRDPNYVSPTKKPVSILKNSNSNILSGSLCKSFMND